MSIFKGPSDYSWSFVIFLYFASPAVAVWFLFPLLVPHPWSMPEATQLQFADGHLLSDKANSQSPYVFQMNSGMRLRLGCLPQAVSATCLEDTGIPLRAISGKSARVGYFYVRDWQTPSLSNVMTTLTVNGQPILTYTESATRLAVWAKRQPEIEHSFLTLGTAALFPLACFLFAIWLTFAKKRDGKNGAPQGMPHFHIGDR